MADLSTLSLTDPADPENVSNGAFRMREERIAIVTSFDVEHTLTGPHTFIYGPNPGLLPAAVAANAGRIFIDTTNFRVLRQTGALDTPVTAWVQLNTVQAYENTASGSVFLIASMVTMASFTVDLPTGGRMIAEFNFLLSSFTGTSNAVIESRIRYNNNVFPFGPYTVGPISMVNGESVQLACKGTIIGTAQTPGTFIVDAQVRQSSGIVGTALVANRQLVATIF